jgi:hypothetical protein
MSAEAPAALHPVTAAHSEQNGDVPGATAKRRSAEPPLKSKILIALAIQVCPSDVWSISSHTYVAGVLLVNIDRIF